MIQIPDNIKDKDKCLEYIKVFIMESNLIECEPAELDAGSSRAIDYLLQTYRWTPKVIEKAHGYLSNIKRDLEAKYRGKFRDCTVYIAGEMRDNQLSISNEMMVWSIRESQGREFNEILDLHFDFERIHPFVDYNGRIGRLLFLARIIQYGLPWTYFTDAAKQFYYMAFNEKVESGLYLSKFV